VLDHAELGQTVTRVDGGYDLVSNGGQSLVVDIRKDGFLPSQRTVEVPWQDYVPVPDLVLLAPDPNVTTVQLTTPGMKIARGSEITDASGTRRATLLFRPETQATIPTDNGTETLSTLTLRLTELTEMPEAMPGSLPPTSAYTYAVDVNVEEAHGRTVQLSHPAFLYVENFLGFAPGTGMPVGVTTTDCQTTFMASLPARAGTSTKPASSSTIFLAIYDKRYSFRIFAIKYNATHRRP
jgi:hypothetical protein